MRAPTRDGSDSSLLAVFAHPDDESLACGGLLAACAERGVRVSLLCLTHGEHGPGERENRLADVRARELGDAARVLGVRDVVLRDHEDGMIPWIDPALLEADIVEAIRRFHPEVVVTFDADGLYGHPDHVAVHERVTAAVAGLGAEGPALWYVSVPAGAMQRLLEAAGDEAPGSDDILGVAADAYGSMAPPPTLVVDAGRLAGRKLSALRCHRSQVAGSALDRIDEEEAARLLGAEQYRRAEVGDRGDTILERLGTAVEATGG